MAQMRPMAVVLVPVPNATWAAAVEPRHNSGSKMCLSCPELQSFMLPDAALQSELPMNVLLALSCSQHILPLNDTVTPASGFLTRLELDCKPRYCHYIRD